MWLQSPLTLSPPFIPSHYRVFSRGPAKALGLEGGLLQQQRENKQFATKLPTSVISQM